VANGFAALTLDAGGKFVTSVEDGHPLYDRLLLWTDRNHNGVSEPDELQPFKELYSSVSTAYSISQEKDKHGNAFLYVGTATLRTGPGLNRSRNPEENAKRIVRIYDVFFRGIR
jgi:hypothetical protein